MEALSKYGHFEMYLATFAETNAELYCLGISVFVQFCAPRAVYEKRQIVVRRKICGRFSRKSFTSIAKNPRHPCLTVQVCKTMEWRTYQTAGA